MILVDSSVWIDYFNDVVNVETDRLDLLLATEPVYVGNLILVEVLQGCTSERDFQRVRFAMTALQVIELGGEQIAAQAALNFRTLRALGVTVRKTIDTIIATRCIESGYRLLHRDRDFEPFVEFLGLQTAV